MISKQTIPASAGNNQLTSTPSMYRKMFGCFIVLSRKKDDLANLVFQRKQNNKSLVIDRSKLFPQYVFKSEVRWLQAKFIRVSFGTVTSTLHYSKRVR